jgi:hypothetical protein
MNPEPTHDTRPVDALGGEAMNQQQSPRSFPTWAMILALALLVASCGDNSVPRHPIKGQVTFQGKPVEMGTIRFTADAAVGNVAPACYAQIKDGRYETNPEESPTTGRYHIQVMGIDLARAVLNPPPGTPPDLPALFLPYETTVEVPAPEGTFNIEVPKSQAIPRR